MGKATGQILVVDDNKEIRESLELFLGRHFTDIHSIANPKTLVNTLNQEHFNIIILDMNFSPGKHSGNEGIFWLREILKIDKDAIVILITAFGKVKLAVDGIKEGAFDFVLKPWDNEKLLSTIKAGLKLRRSNSEIEKLKGQQVHINSNTDQEFMLLESKSTSMKKIEELISKVAGTDANVLITGENGTGKEVVAREIHRKSMRSDQVFMPVDLSALTESLFESELFGYKQGAFTDAKEDRPGKIEVSNKGTLFLDEIGNLPLQLQSKLLTVIQTKNINRLGSSQMKHIDFRLISATNKLLPDLIKKQEFREDLFFRINTIHIEIPPLRNRKEDILPLCNFYLKQYSKKYNKPSVTISKSAQTKLENYPWPGNIRELKHLIERAVILSNDDKIEPEDLALTGTSILNAKDDVLNLTELEKQAIIKAIDKADGNMSKASELLGISRTTLYSKISKYGLQ